MYDAGCSPHPRKSKDHKQRENKKKRLNRRCCLSGGQGKGKKYVSFLGLRMWQQFLFLTLDICKKKTVFF
jgi:hypothetical protein